MRPGQMRTAMDLFVFEKSANLKHPNIDRSPASATEFQRRIFFGGVL